MKQKILIRLTAILMIAFVFVLFIYNILRGEISDVVINIIMKVSGFDYNDAMNVYENIFRNHWYEFMLFFFIITVIILLYLLVSWFEGYFVMINAGIDALTERSVSDILMPPEMRFMEEKLKNVQDTLQQQEEQKDDLVMYLAHDIRTPLTSVIGYLNILNDVENMPNEQRKKYIETTLEKAERLDGLINEFFEITCYSQNSIELNKEKVDLYYLLVQLSDEVYPQAQQQKKKIILEVDENVTAYGDAEKLGRAFLNILKNAITYSKSNTEIIISTRETNSGTSIEFLNTGNTLSDLEQRNIFGKFYRLDEARQTYTGGAGLGLAIAKDIINLHNGKITVSSENGITVFEIWIPDQEID